MPDVASMSDHDWRDWVVTALTEINTSLSGVSGDKRNRGLCGAVDDLERQVDYEITQRKTVVDPKINAVREEVREARKALDIELMRQKAWRNGLTFALGLMSGIVVAIGTVNI